MICPLDSNSGQTWLRTRTEPEQGRANFEQARAKTSPPASLSSVPTSAILEAGEYPAEEERAVPPKTSRSGKVYYPQPDPTKRGFGSIKLRLTVEEEKEFLADAAPYGSIVGYIRYLWDQDRIRRGLEPVPHPGGRRKAADEGPSE